MASNSIGMRVYGASPVWLQNIACTLEGWRNKRERHGGCFAHRLATLRESEHWTGDKIEAFQASELQRLVAYAAKNVPYYTRIFSELRLKPEDIRSRSDLSVLPVLTKEMVKAHAAELITQDARKKQLTAARTSGSTGKSLEFYVERELVRFRWAVWWRHRYRFGVQYGEPFATFTGKAAVPIDAQKPPFWRENYSMRQTVFTMQHVTPDKVGEIVGRLNGGRFAYYAGYPSIIFSLAQMIEAAGLEITSPPKAIFTGAEKLHPFQRKFMQDVFKCIVTDQYGFSEGCGNASRCEHDMYHEDFEFGILEPLDAESLGGGRVRGKILATGFGSHAFPFIRYEVGDVGIWSGKACTCGRESRCIEEIEGRYEDYVVTPEGAHIQRFDYIFKATAGVREAQVVQKAIDRLVIKVVARADYSNETEALLKTEVAKMISPTMKVEVVLVDSIPRTEAGKFRAVVSELAGRQGVITRKR